MQCHVMQFQTMDNYASICFAVWFHSCNLFFLFFCREAEAVEDEELSQARKDEQLDEKDEVMMQDKEDEDEYLDDDYEEEELKGNEYEDEMVVKEDEDEDEEEEEDDMLGDEQEENTMLEEEEEDTMPLLGEEGESPMSFLSDEGSGSEEGSGGGITDQLFMPFESDAGSGESMTEEEPNTGLWRTRCGICGYLFKKCST